MDSKDKSAEDLRRTSRRRFLRGTALAGLAVAGAARAVGAQDFLKKLPPLPDPRERTDYVPEDQDVLEDIKQARAGFQRRKMPHLKSGTFRHSII